MSDDVQDVRGSKLEEPREEGGEEMTQEPRLTYATETTHGGRPSVEVSVLRSLAEKRAKVFFNRNAFMLAPGSTVEQLRARMADEIYSLLMEHLSDA
jgi:hypothetical protein